MKTAPVIPVSKASYMFSQKHEKNCTAINYIARKSAFTRILQNMPLLDNRVFMQLNHRFKSVVGVRSHSFTDENPMVVDVNDSHITNTSDGNGTGVVSDNTSSLNLIDDRCPQNTTDNSTVLQVDLQRQDNITSKAFLQLHKTCSDRTPYKIFAFKCPFDL